MTNQTVVNLAKQAVNHPDCDTALSCYNDAVNSGIVFG